MIGKRFKIKNPGKFGNILGMDILRKLDRDVLHLSQEKFALRIVERFGKNDAKEHYTTMDLNMNWHNDFEVTDVPYRK